MSKAAPNKSRREVVEDAVKQHQEVRFFLNKSSIKKMLPPQNKRAECEVVLLHRLCDVTEPITYRDDVLGIMGSQATVSNAVKRLNKFLKEFSNKFDVLKERNVAIAVYCHIGGLQIGRYFTCQDTRTGKYLDANEIKKLLADTWLAFRKGKASETWPEKLRHSLIRKLRTEAISHLAEKLHNRESDYQPLSMEYGLVKTSTEVGPVTVEKQQRPDDHNRLWKDFDPTEFLNPQNIYILSSDTGTGKTTFLNHLQLEIIKKTHYIPILVHASALENREFEDLKTFISCLTKIINLRTPEMDVRDFFNKHFEKIILLVDGLDQIEGSGTDYSNLLDKLLKAFNKNLIIASRPFAVISQEENQDIKFLRLKPFDEPSQKKYFAQYYNRALEICCSCWELMRIPMLACMVRTLIEKGRDKQIKNRANLYKRFIDYILTPDIDVGYKHDNIQSNEDIQTGVRQKLAEISFEALATDKPHIQKILPSFYRKYITSSDRTIENILKHGLVNLIVDKTRGIDKCLYFTHQSFQEYLAAEWAAQRKKRIDLILDKMWDPKWKEVIKFLSGIIGEDFIKQIYSPNCKDNYIHSRLFLAVECLSEIKSSISPLLETYFINEIKEVFFENISLSPDVIINLVKMRTIKSLDEAWELIWAENDWEIMLILADILEPKDLRLFYSDVRCKWLLSHIEKDCDTFSSQQLTSKFLASWIEKIPNEILSDILRGDLYNNRLSVILKVLSESFLYDFKYFLSIDVLIDLILSLINEMPRPSSINKIFDVLPALNRIAEYLSDKQINSIQDTCWTDKPQEQFTIFQEIPKICVRFDSKILDPFLAELCNFLPLASSNTMLNLINYYHRFSKGQLETIYSYLEDPKMQPYIAMLMVYLTEKIDSSIAEKVLKYLGDPNNEICISAMICCEKLEQYIEYKHLLIIEERLRYSTEFLRHTSSPQSRYTSPFWKMRHYSIKTIAKFKEKASPQAIRYIAETIDSEDFTRGSYVNLAYSLWCLSKVIDNDIRDLIKHRIQSNETDFYVIPALCVLLGIENLSQNDISRIIQIFQNADAVYSHALLNILKQIHAICSLPEN